MIAIPDCGVLPEQLAGLLPGVEPESQYARLLAENGCRVIVPLLINREERIPKLTNREWLYRSAFELGRGLDRLRSAEGSRLRGLGCKATGRRGPDRRYRLGRGRLAQSLCGGPGPANRCRLRERLLRSPGGHLAGAARPQRVRPAGAVRRRGTGGHDRTAAADRRSVPPAPRSRFPAGVAAPARTVYAETGRTSARKSTAPGRSSAAPTSSPTCNWSSAETAGPSWLRTRRSTALLNALGVDPTPRSDGDAAREPAWSRSIRKPVRPGRSTNWIGTRRVAAGEPLRPSGSHDEAVR